MSTVIRRLAVTLCIIALIAVGFVVFMRPAAAPADVETGDAGRLDTHVLTRTPWGPGIERVTYAYATDTGATLEVFGFAKGAYRVSLRATSTALGTDGWMRMAPNVVAGINGVYFREDLSPAGLLNLGGEGSGRAFDWDKTGLMVFGDAFEIRATTSTPQDLASLGDAAQSYPFLIKDGAPAVSGDSGLRARRSFIGTSRDGRVWIGVLSNDDISLFDLAQRLAELDLSWEDVLNLDGGPSSGLFVRDADRTVAFPSYTGVPNVILVEKIEK